MKGKIAFALGAAVGYVLGTRAGRERYEQIKQGADKLWHTEPVQRGAAVVRDAVDSRVGDLKDTAIDAGAKLLGSLAKRVQPERSTAKPEAAATAAATEQPAEPAQTAAPAKTPAPAKSTAPAKTAAKNTAAKNTTAKNTAQPTRKSAARSTPSKGTQS